jgi:hypothetical protein
MQSSKDNPPTVVATPPPPASSPDSEPGATADSSYEQAKERGRTKAQAIKEQVLEQARHTGEQAKAQARTMVETAKDKAREYADEKQSYVASEANHVAAAARAASQTLRDKGDEGIAGYVDTVADQADRMAGYLDQRDVFGLINDARNFGRRHPEVFLGGMFLGGLALARFLKASDEASHDEQDDVAVVSEPDRLQVGGPVSAPAGPRVAAAPPPVVEPGPVANVHPPAEPVTDPLRDDGNPADIAHTTPGPHAPTEVR